MSTSSRKLGLLLVLVAASGWLTAQENNPTAQPNSPAAPMGQQGTYDNVPLYKIEVVARDIPAINYFHRSGSTKIGFRGTELLPQAKGEAKVDSKLGRTVIDADFEGLTPSRQSRRSASQRVP
jgi:hypothetical protein